jgi:hypothetical protein
MSNRLNFLDVAPMRDAVATRVWTAIMVQVVMTTPRRITPREHPMARAKNVGNGRLEEALASLAEQQAAFAQQQSAIQQQQAAFAQQQIALMQLQNTLMQNQAAFLARAAQIDARVAEIDARMAETNRLNAERFARIEALLLEHNRILQALPDAIRDKIGFKAPGP